MGKLIAQELLARPIPVRVATNFDAEQDMTAADREHLVDFHDLSPDMLERIGQSVRRNELIVQHYVQNRSKYGKTLVFTTNIAAAALLKAAFNRALAGTGVEAEYLASQRPDLVEGERAPERSEVLRTFEDPRSALDVLINVDMLTEGVDLPGTQSAFLARPTSSAILFRQMVGRALRVTPSKKLAYIVSFDDQWTTFGGLYTTEQWMLEEEVDEVGEEPVSPPPGDEPPPGSVTPDPPKVDAPPPLAWDELEAVVHAIRQNVRNADADVFEAVPHGMYVLEYEVDGEAVHHVIHVYEHQLPCWQELFRRVNAMTAEQLSSIDVAALDDDIFFDCASPRPSPLEVELIVRRRAAGDATPEYIPLASRAECDPREIARIARERDLRRSEENALLEQRYTALARQIYGSTSAFRAAFDDAMRELEHPGERPPPKGVPMFEPPASNPLQPGPHHDLAKLMAETLERGSALLGRPLRHDGELAWSRRIIKGWYGVANLGNQPGVGRIRINVLLDSPDVSAETMRFLLWHEFLHLHLLALHTEEFRRLEHLWPRYTVCDRELDALNERFGIQYW
jgi:hypothetical protein